MDIEHVLKAKGVRPTAMRILVYKHMASLQVATGLSNLELAFDKAERTTLYRTLKTFEEKGLVHQVDDGTGVLKYALCEPGCMCDVHQDLHVHFYCISCKETVCLPKNKVPVIHLPEGYTAQDINLVVKGICVKCKGVA